MRGRDKQTRLVFVDGITLPFLIVLFVQVLLLDQFAYVDVFERDWGFFREQLCMGCLARSRGTCDNDARGGLRGFAGRS